MAHDLPFDRPADFYTQAAATTLKNYMTEGNDDRDKNYYLRMYLGCYRAADYLAHRPDWDGRTLVVMGTSQGGLQAVMTAGFYPGITAMIANVPAGCDTTGPLVGRAGGHPYWYNNAKGKTERKADHGDEPLLRRGQLRVADQVPRARRPGPDRRDLPARRRLRGVQPDPGAEGGGGDGQFRPQGEE